MRPRLLFLCQTLPYPPDGGVWIRTYHVLRLLARAFDISGLCFERAPMPGNRAAGSIDASRRALRDYADVEVFPVPQRHSAGRLVWDHLRSVATGRVYTAYAFESDSFRHRLREILSAGDIGLIHCDSLALSGYLPDCDGVPVVCVHHDVESSLLQRRAAIDPHPARRAYLRRQAALMRRVERTWCARVALNVAVSPQDRTALKQLAPAARVAIVPNGVDLDEFTPGRADGYGVAFVGGLHWGPNLDALRFFCADILPCIRAVSRVPVTWIGSASLPQQREFASLHDVEVTGYVADVRPLMQAAACHVVPLRAGGGTRLKILNSWAMGKPVVSTSVGCEGLEAIDGENILIRDDPKAFAAAVTMVLENPMLRRRLASAGRATAERHYGWDAIGQAMVETYQGVANARVSDAESALAVRDRVRAGQA